MSTLALRDARATSRPAPRVPYVALAGAAGLFGVAAAAGRPEIFAAALAALVGMAALLARPAWAFLLALVLLPLELVGRIVWSQPALTWGKVVLALCLVGMVTQMLLRDERLDMPQSTWALFGVLAVGVLGSFVGGFGLTFDTFKMVVAMGSNILLVILAAHLLRTERQIAAGVLAVVMSSVIVVAFGIVEIVTKESALVNPMLSEPLWAPGTTDLYRITATFYDPNALARYLSFSVLWAMCALALPALRRWRPFLLLMIGLQGFCLLNTFSRAGFLATAVIGAPLVVAALVRKWKGAGVVASSLLGVAAAVAAWPLLGVLMGRFDDPTAGGRVGIVSASVPVIARSPLVGYGREHIASALGTVLHEPTDPHNLYTEILLSVGVIGALVAVAWAGPMVRSLYRRWRRRDPYARLVLAPLIAVLIFGMSLQGFDGYELWVPLAFALPILRLARQREETACV